PYGRYRLFGSTVFVAPLESTQIEIIQDSPGVVRLAREVPPPDMRRYPVPFSLQGLLSSLEPASVTEPLDFTGLSDNRRFVDSERGFSWTDTRYKLNGLDATDSWQPGFAMIFPNIQAIADIAVRSAFSRNASLSYGTEIGVFLVEPRATWHG